MCQPTVLLYVDVNKTVTMIDSAKAEGGLDQMLTRLFAEEVRGVWSVDTPEMTYYEYTRHCFPHSSEERQGMLRIFWVALMGHPREAEIVQRNESLMVELNAPEGELRLFKSFKRLLTALDEAPVKYRLVLSTFGGDGQKVVEELSKTHPHVANVQLAQFKGDVLVRDQETYESWDAVWHVFKESTSHMLVQHDFSFWATHEKRSAFGKPCVVDPEDQSTVVVMADDNLFEKSDPEFDIVRAITPRGELLPLASLRDRCLFQVNPLRAAEDEGYFVDMVSRALQAAGHVVNF